MATHINAPSKRLCGHVDEVCFSSRGRAGRLSDRVYASSTLCGDCRSRINLAMRNPSKRFYKMPLPDLVGRDRAVAWAKTIRLANVRSLGPVMAQLAESPDPYARASLAVLTMLFKITSAQFWIDGREFLYGSAWVISEVEHLIRPRSLNVHASSDSAYCYWLQVDPSPIREARASSDALLTHEIIPTLHSTVDSSPKAATNARVFL